VAGQLRDHDLIPSQGMEVFLKICWSSTGSTQPPIQWVLGWSGQGVNLTTYLHLMPRLRLSRTIPPSHMPLCCIQWQICL